MKIEVLEPPKLSTYQCFLQWFTDACQKDGLPCMSGVKLPKNLRLIIAKLGVSRTIGFFAKKSKKLIVPCGGYPDFFVFPYGYMHEIIPVLWDTWPRYHSRIIKSFQRHHIRLAFFTQRQVAKWVHSCLPRVRCVWLPEGINVAVYKKGGLLRDRNIDLLELGRLVPSFHSALKGNKWKHLFTNPKEGLLFSDFKSLTEGLANTKITVCFPRCDTHPEMTGDIETLTQRYWECMLSRTVILGRAPQELCDFIGYNPCIEVDMKNPREQIESILNSIQTGDKYQALVDCNYETALKYAPWEQRINMIQKELALLEKECIVNV